MIYFDNAATTKIDDDILEKMLEFYKFNYANVDSIHNFGIDTYKKIEEEKKVFEEIFGVNKNLFHFTSGGGEANNIAITSVLNGKKTGHIITSLYEHPSVLKAIENYKNIEVSYVGKITYEDIKKEIREDTFFISLTSCNSELGIVYDIDEIATRIKKEYKNILIHTDFVQALGHKKIDLSNIDMMTISSHKIHGPKGVGAIYIKKGIKIAPNLFGENKNNGIMKRTLPNEIVYGFLLALKKVYNKEKEDKILEVKNYAIHRLKEIYKENIYIVENGNSNILSFTIKNLWSEILFNFLSNEKIYISVGAACSSGASKIVKLLKLPKDFEKGMVRISFSKNNTKEEVDVFIEKMKEFNKYVKLF